MKKIYYSFIIMAIGLLQACTPETELLFNKPASERMSDALRNYQDLLVSASDGWLVEYYPHSSRTYGGFNLYFQFDGQEVTVMSEVESSLLTVDEASSLYSLGEDMGPTLNFDTYNEVLNFFSDPALNVGGGSGYGLEGDYEFVFMSGDATEIILRGKKTKNTIRMTPMTKDSWQTYREDVLEMWETFNAPAFSMAVNGKAITIAKPLSAYNRFVITYEEGRKNELVNASMAYIFTPEGIRFYEPLTIDGVTIQDFTYNNTSGQMESKDGKAVIGLLFPPVEEIFVNSLTSSEWYLSSSAMGIKFLGGFNTIKTGLTAVFAHQLAYAWIGASVEKKLPSFSYVSFDGTYIYPGSTLINVSKVEGKEGQIAIESTTQYEQNGAVLNQYIPNIQQFVNSLKGIYNITTTDPLRNITSVTLTDPEDATKTMTLTLDEVVFP